MNMPDLPFVQNESNRRKNHARQQIHTRTLTQNQNQSFTQKQYARVERFLPYYNFRIGLHSSKKKVNTQTHIRTSSEYGEQLKIVLSCQKKCVRISLRLFVRKDAFLMGKINLKNNAKIILLSRKSHTHTNLKEGKQSLTAVLYCKKSLAPAE